MPYSWFISQTNKPAEFLKRVAERFEQPTMAHCKMCMYRGAGARAVTGGGKDDRSPLRHRNQFTNVYRSRSSWNSGSEPRSVGPDAENHQQPTEQLGPANMNEGEIWGCLRDVDGNFSLLDTKRCLEKVISEIQSETGL